MIYTAMVSGEDFKQMAIEAVYKMDAPKAYLMEYKHEDLDEVEFQVCLNDAQVEEVRAILAVCEAEGLSLEEYFEEYPAPEYLQVAEQWVYPDPIAIHLDKVFCPCDLKVALFDKGVANAPRVVDTRVWLGEDVYASLLEWQMNHRDSTFFDLYNSAPKLYDSVYEVVRDLFAKDFVSPYVTPLFAVELTGMERMAFELCGEMSRGGEIYYSNTDVQEHSYLHIENRVLNFFYERWSDFECESCDNVSDVNAIEVQELLGVADYQGIFDVIKERYGDKEGVKRFAEFLKENNVSFTSK